MAEHDELLPRDEAIELIEGLERASRRSRPFLLYGLIAVIAGFISVSVYLYQQREQERAQVATLRQESQALEDTLERARRLALRLDSDPAARRQLLAALNVAIRRADALDTVVEKAGTGPAEQQPLPVAPQPATRPVATSSAPAEPAPAAVASSPVDQAQPAEMRIVVRISEESQLPMAWELAARLNRALPDGTRVIADLPEAGSRRGDNSLRCFHLSDCRRLVELGRFVQARLTRPTLRTYRESDRLEYPPAGTFEIWFAPGQIEPVLD